MRYATTSPAELPDYLPYGRPFSATVAYSSPRPSASRSLSSSSKAERFGELRFFVDEDSAMEESASLVGQRDGELPSVAGTRRARSTGSKVGCKAR